MTAPDTKSALARVECFSPRAIDRYREFTARLDDVLLEVSAAPVYIDQLAHRIGTSVRTLQIATNAIHGLSLHRYVRLKRLWLVYLQLSNGRPGQSVKAAALANGFWHMGEFARLYKATFGEKASETLARAILAGATLQQKRSSEN